MLAAAWKRTSFKVLMGSNNARLMALFHQQQLGLYADQSKTKALPSLALTSTVECLLRVKDGRAGRSTGTSPVPQIADDFVHRASRQRWASKRHFRPLSKAREPVVMFNRELLSGTCRRPVN